MREEGAALDTWWTEMRVRRGQGWMDGGVG